MPVDVIGIDHIYVTVADLARSRAFYRFLVDVLGFREAESTIAGDPHAHFYNRHFGFSLRPARTTGVPHDPYAPGLHHFCFRVESEGEVDAAAAELAGRGIAATAPRYYPEYAPDYYATFFTDPDGVRLEITNFRRQRRERMDHWSG
jgi:glyoxylase I family protein